MVMDGSGGSTQCRTWPVLEVIRVVVFRRVHLDTPISTRLSTRKSQLVRASWPERTCRRIRSESTRRVVEVSLGGSLGACVLTGTHRDPA